MYIVAIAWLFVAIMTAITEDNLTAGVITFLFWGVLPLSIVLYLMAWPLRRRHRLAQEAAELAALRAAAEEKGNAESLPADNQPKT